MSSGRKRKIMIACVTFDTVKITDPIKFYQVEKVHLIHYVSDKTDSTKKKIYQGFYDEVKNQIEKMNPKPEIEEHNKKVYDFSEMLATVLSIIREEIKLENPKKEFHKEESEIFINTSAGTADYSAAATIAAMMHWPKTIPFSVPTKEYMIKNEKVKEVYYDGEKPVGLAKAVNNPIKLPTYTIEMPKEHLVMGLRMLHNRLGKKESVSAKNMVADMRRNNIWYKDAPKSSKNPDQTDAVNYTRDFMNVWIKNGWVKKNDNTNKPVITEDGLRVIQTFYVDTP